MKLLVCISVPFSGSTFVRRLFSAHDEILPCQELRADIRWLEHPYTTTSETHAWGMCFDHIQNAAAQQVLTFWPHDARLLVPVRHPWMVMRSYCLRAGSVTDEPLTLMRRLCNAIWDHPEAIVLKVDALEAMNEDERMNVMDGVLRTLDIGYCAVFEEMARTWGRVGELPAAAPQESLVPGQADVIAQLIERSHIRQRMLDCGIEYEKGEPWLRL